MSTESDQVNTGALATLLFASVFAVIAVASAVTAYVREDVDQDQAQKNANFDQPVRELKARQKAELDAPPGYVGTSRETVSLPIQRAMQLVVSEIAHDPSSATPAPPPSAAPPDAGAAAGEPAADADKPEGGKAKKKHKAAPKKPVEYPDDVP